MGNIKNIKLLFVLLIIATILLGATVLSETDEDSKKLDSYSEWTDGWSVKINDKLTEFDELPARVDSKGNSTIILNNVIPDSAKASESVLLFITNCEITVSIDGEERTHFIKSPDTVSKSPGVGWLEVNISKNDAGKTITIESKGCYIDCYGKLPTIYYGDGSSMYQGMLRDKTLYLFFSVALITIGILTLIASLFISGRATVNESFFWLGASATSVGIWTLIETRMITLFFGHSLFFSQITFISLLLTMVSIINYIEITYMRFNDEITRRVKIGTSILIGLNFVLQVFGVTDLRELNGYFNFLWILLIVFMIIKFFIRKKIVKKKQSCEKNETEREYSDKRQKHIGDVSIFIVVTFVIMAISVYTFTDKAYYSIIALVGFWLYDVIQLIGMFQNLCEAYAQKAKYRDIEKEALMDALTQVENRMSFEKDCVYIYNDDLSRYSVIMFDINNLKYFNDTYGHAKGDWYIITCSKAIVKIFGENGKIYRIGGDEFCAVIEKLSLNSYSQFAEKLKNELKPYENEEFADKFGLAAGFAKFNYKTDHEFSDIVKRADKEMYKKKEYMKKEKIKERFEVY